MKKKNIIILSILIVIFTATIISKENIVQTDTFWDIPIGKYIIENGIDMMDHLTWHSDLSYIYTHWIFNIVEYTIYNMFDFLGIYIFVMIIASITMVTVFILLIKQGNKVSISFIMTLLTAYFCKDVFVARTQIITFLLFILEYYFLERLVKTNQKRYSVGLIIIPIIIANIHSSLWVVTLVFYLPYIAEFIICNIFKKLNIYKEDSKIIIEKNDIKLLVATMVISIFTGLLTPLRRYSLYCYV